MRRRQTTGGDCSPLDRGEMTFSRVGRDTERGRVCGSSSRGRLASATALLVVSSIACTRRNPWIVHAYVPSPRHQRSHHQHREVHSALPKSHTGARTNVNVQRAQNTHLFGTAGGDDIQGAINKTMIYDGSLSQEINSKLGDETVFDNLMPSATNQRMRMVKRPSTLSSSALLPLNSAPETSTASWKENLIDLSNLASLLCVLDCTLLPFVSIAIPALSWGAGALGGATAATATGGGNSVTIALSSVLPYLPAVSHAIALYFVIPVGLLTTGINYFFGHKQVRFSLLSLAGVALVYAANSSAGVGIPTVDGWLASKGIATAALGSHAHVHDACGAVVGAATGMLAHTCPEGLAHRMTNTLGCAFLLGSNYSSKKYMEEKSQGCAASALVEAWDGDDGGRRVMMCPPGCNCEAPEYGTRRSSSSSMEGEVFFQWGDTSGDESKETRGDRAFTRFRR